MSAGRDLTDLLVFAKKIEQKVELDRIVEARYREIERDPRLIGIKAPRQLISSYSTLKMIVAALIKIGFDDFAADVELLWEDLARRLEPYYNLDVQMYDKKKLEAMAAKLDPYGQFLGLPFDREAVKGKMKKEDKGYRIRGGVGEEEGE